MYRHRRGSWKAPTDRLLRPACRSSPLDLLWEASSIELAEPLMGAAAFAAPG